MDRSKIRKYLLLTAITILVALAGSYLLRPNRWETHRLLTPKGKQTGTDFMLSSLNVTAIAQDSKKLMWIGTSAGINVYNGRDYIQFFHDSQDSTALPDDYINVLHRDKQGRMWVGTQNGLARYVGGYRFHRINLPTANGNITHITDCAKGKEVLASNGKDWFRINGKDEIQKWNGKEKVSPCNDSPQHSSQNLFRHFPKTSLALQKPVELISIVFKDAGGNLWIGFRNAGYQVISENLIAYKQANHNLLAETTRGKDITCLATIGNHILAGTTLRLYVYDTNGKSPKFFYYKDIFRNSKSTIHSTASRQDSISSTLNGIVAFDNNHAWLVGNDQILSCQISNGTIVRQSTIPSTSAIGTGTSAGENLYASCQSPHILRCKFGASQAEHIPFKNQWYDNETQLTTLHDGHILLFMKNMHFALLSPKTQKVTELEIHAPKGNIDPAFVRQDSRGEIWLGTKRSGLYQLDIKQRKVKKMNFVNDVHIQALQEDRLHQIWITTLKDAICHQPASGAVLMNSLVSSSQNEWTRQYFDNSICLSPQGNVVFGSSDGCIFLPQEAGDKMRIANRQPSPTNKRTSTSQPPLTAHYDQSRALEKGLCIYAIDIKTQDGAYLVLNDRTKDGSHYTLAHDENDLTINFFYPNYSRRSSLMYQYKLEGMDKDWHEPTYEHTAHFANLSPGEYTFHLRMVSSPNLPPLTQQSVTFTIQPSPWFSAAAWWLYACCLAILIYYINSLYLSIRTNRLLLQQEQHEREREQHTNEMNMSFFANISHEFRNPITIIAGPLLSLRSDTTLPAPVQQTLGRICLSVNRMLRLIDQMLDFNQLETDALRLKVAYVNAKDELQPLFATFEESTHVRGIHLETIFAEGDYNGWMDIDKIEKIASNLFTNALKHTANHGAIRISIACLEKNGDDSGNGLSEESSRKTLEISIWNEGQKISEDKLQDVFKRYYQLTETQGSHHYGWGTGIGLYYAKRLVGLHHGEITVRNTSEDIPTVERTSTEGVEFRFCLPIAKEDYLASEQVNQKTGVMQIPVEIPDVKWEEQKEMEQCSETEGKAKPTTESKPKILIVDDDVDVAQYIRSIFQNDYMVENRYTAEDALEDLDQTRPDIILSDIIMGEMSGYDFCKTVKSNLASSHIPIILITAKSNMNEQINGLKLGAVAYITKPFDPFYLKAMVESQLHNMTTLRQRLGESTTTENLAEPIADTLSEQDRKFMDELYRLMEKRSAEMELNVTTICRDLLISQSKFNYKLKELTGDTPGTFFRKYKLNKAAQWLKEGKHNVSEVAVMTGFSTAAHFSVAFKKQFGVSPSEYHPS